MKLVRVFFYFLTTLVSGNASATLLPNGDFENWTEGWNVSPPFGVVISNPINGLVREDGGNIALLTAFPGETTTLTQEVALSPDESILFHWAIPLGADLSSAFFIFDEQNMPLVATLPGVWDEFRFDFTGPEGFYTIGVGVSWEDITWDVTDLAFPPLPSDPGFVGVYGFRTEPTPVSASAVPEPGTWLLLLSGILALFTIRRNSHSFLNKTRACAS
jgi:hypothetical protein